MIIIRVRWKQTTTMLYAYGRPFLLQSIMGFFFQ